MQHLDPKAFWLFVIQYIVGITFLYFTLFLTFGVPLFLVFFEGSSAILLSIFGIYLGIGLYILLIVLGVVWAKAAYNNYLYELRDDGFRKESGVIIKRYVTIPYERIQNVDIVRGVWARALGLSDLQIQTAGQSLPVVAEGRLPALQPEVAEKLRDELVKRAKAGHQGL